MTIISKIERSHESSERQHVHLLLKFLAQLQFKLNRLKENSKCQLILFAKVNTFFLDFRK